MKRLVCILVLSLFISALALLGGQRHALAQAFSQGDIVEVYNTRGEGLKVRDAPCGNRMPQGNKADGSIGLVLEGPRYCVLEGRGYYWWRIRWSDGLEGWSAQNWLRTLPLPSIISVAVSPSSVAPGGTINLTYTVNNQGKGIGGAIAPLLGASLQPSGGGAFLSDPPNDRKATIAAGLSSVSRPFVVPATAAPGTYDVLVSLMADLNNNGRIDAGEPVWHLRRFFGVIQVRATCTISIFPTSQPFSSAGGSGSVNVTAPSGCPWTATSHVPWITITSGSSGNGNGTVNYSVASNPSTTPRTGTMTINGQTFTVTQAGAPSAPSTGTIQVNATLNGAPWFGSVSFGLTGPQTIDGTTVPATFSNRPTGSYTLSYRSGGPSGATLTSITPSATQTLSPGGTITFTLNFSSARPQNPVLEVTPNSLNFGDVRAGQCSGSQSFTVRNIGAGTLSGTASTSAPFLIVSGGSFSLRAGESASVVVRFCPTGVGQANGRVNFASNGGNTSRDVSGNGVSTGGGVSTCSVTPISIGMTVIAALTTSDGRSPIRESSYCDRYTFSGTAGQQVAILLTSSSFDTFLYLIGPDGRVLAQDDDGGGGTNSRIPAGSGYYTLPSSGTYTIEVTSYYSNRTGSYSLSLSGPTASTPPSSGTCPEGYPYRSPRLVGTGIAAGRDFGWFCYKILADRSIEVGKWQYRRWRTNEDITLIGKITTNTLPFVSITLTEQQKSILGVLRSSIQVHENAADLFEQALNSLVTAESRYRQSNPGQRLILSYGGTVALRLMRTSNEVSRHSWGIAIDLNYKDNECPMKKLTEEELKKPEEERYPNTCAGGRNKFLYDNVFMGWTWGGTWWPPYYTDPMHFELPVRRE